jgi:vacuolar-type H+-ATPase subunit I/STV1
MNLLNEVDKPASDIDEYVNNLEAVLNHKIDLINNVKSKLVAFREHLREEELLSKKFYEQRHEVMDIFDLNAHGSDNLRNDDLLEDLQGVM